MPVSLGPMVGLNSRRGPARHQAAVLLAAAGLALAVATVLGGCDAGSATRHLVLQVPGQYRSIQSAVDHAQPGDLVLIAPGVYHASVTSSVADLVIRGRNRNSVILDGGNTLPNGITLAANGDAVENLTVRRYAVNGVLITRQEGYGDGSVVRGYRVSYVTAYDNGLYGLYAFDATDGLFDHDDASGQPDSGIYIGQCRPCNVVVEDSVAGSNRVGFEAANASGGLTVVDSLFDGNRAGVVVESDTTEKLLPQVGAVVAGNVISDNDNPDTPTSGEDADVFGYGIAIGGGSDDDILRNRVEGNTSVGILVTDEAGYSPRHDVVSGNALSANHVDLVYLSGVGGAAATNGNCFTGNTFSSSAPSQIETVMACGHSATVTSSFTGVASPSGVNYVTIAPPAPQPGMAAAATAPAVPASHEPPTVDMAAVTLPAP
jgi:ribosomal protein S6E (S10)